MTVGLREIGEPAKLVCLTCLEEMRQSDLWTFRPKQCLIINFETWSYAQFNDRKSLPMACLFALTAKLEEGLKERSCWC